jgi:hypothetical protein
MEFRSKIDFLHLIYNMKKIMFIGLISLLSFTAFAGVPSSFTYQGVVMNSAGTAPLTSVVSLKLSLYDPTGACLLYQEQQANIDLSQTNGTFAVQVGSAVGAVKRVGGADQGLTMSAVFANNGQILAGSTPNCTAGYTPAANDVRLLRVTVTNGGSTVTISPDLQINAVPNAMVAETLQGQTLAQVTPAGILVSFTGTTCPSGYLAADGTPYSATTYPSLANVYNNGSTYLYGGTVVGGTFNVPNTQGLFLRGVGSQTINSKSYSSTLGTIQSDLTAVNGLHDTGHTHNSNYLGSTANSGQNGWYGSVASYGNFPTGVGYANLSGDAETRPANLGVKYCIKY